MTPAFLFQIFRWAAPRFVGITDRNQPVIRAKSHDYLQMRSNEQHSKTQNLYHYINITPANQGVTPMKKSKFEPAACWSHENLPR